MFFDLMVHGWVRVCKLHTLYFDKLVSVKYQD